MPLSRKVTRKPPKTLTTVADFAGLLNGPEASQGEAGLRAILEVQPGNLPAVNALVPYLSRTGRNAEAVDVARSCLEAGEAPYRLLLAEALLAAGNIEEARETCPDAMALRSALFAQMRRGEFQNRIGCRDEAARSAQAARDELPDDAPPKMLLRLGRIAREAGSFELARDCYGDCAGRDDLEANDLVDAANGLLSVAGDADAAALMQQVAARIEKRLGQEPENPKLRLSLARLALQLGKRAEAADILKEFQKPELLETPDLVTLTHLLFDSAAYAEAQAMASRALTRPGITAQAARRLVIYRARSLGELGLFAEAGAVIDEALSERQDGELERLGFKIARKSGDESLTTQARNRARRGGSLRLPRSLIDGLADIPAEPAPPMASMPLSMLVPWKLAGLPDEEWPRWASRYNWGAKASLLLSDWFTFAGADRQGELADLLLPVDAEPLRDFLQDGKSLLIAGTHMGPSVAGFPYLTSIRSDIGIVGAGGRDLPGLDEIFVSGRGELGGVMAMRRQLRDGGIVALLIDGAIKSETRSVVLGGTALLFSTIVARLSRMLSVPSVWIQPEWCDGRIRLRIRALPPPPSGDDEPEWEARWFEAFGANLEEFLRSCSPESAAGLLAAQPSAGRADRTRASVGRALVT